MRAVVFLILWLLVGVEQVFALTALKTNANSSSPGNINAEFGKANANFSELATELNGKANATCFASESAFLTCFPSLSHRPWVVQATAPADTTLLWFDSDQIVDAVVLKVHNGTTWVEQAMGEGGTGAVDSVNGATGTVVLDADDISDTSTTKKFTTAAEKAIWDAKQDAVETSPLTVSMVTGVFPGTGDCLGSNGERVACGGGGASAISDLTDWPSGLTATELGYVNGVTGSIQSQIDALSAGGIPHVSSGYPASAGAWNYNTTDNRLYTRKSNGDVYYTSALTLATAADVTPEGFAFADVTDAELSTQYTACDQVTGIDWPATVTASGGTAAICTSSTYATDCGTFGTSPGTVSNNGWVCARHTSSASNSTPTNTPVTVGTASDTFTTTTVATSGDAEIIAYFNCDSATTGQALQKGTGNVTIGTSVTTTTGQVSNALDNNDATYSAGYLLIPGTSNVDWGTGTLGFWVYYNEYSSASVVESTTDYAQFRVASPFAGTARFTFRGTNVDASGFAIGSWHFVEIAWNYATTSAAIRVDGGSWSTTSAANGSTAPSGNLRFLNASTGSVNDTLMDQIIISNVYQKDIYAARNNTSF